MSIILRFNRYRPLFTSATGFYQHQNHYPISGARYADQRPHQCASRRSFSIESAYASISNSLAVAHVQDGLVRLHDCSGMPWWATIIVSTVLLRTIVTLPLTIYQQRIAARLELISAEMPAIVQELKQETVVAKRQFGLNDAQARVLYNRSVKKQWNALIVRENCHPLKTFVVIWGQLPLWIIQSMALRNLLGMLPDPTTMQAKVAYAELTMGGLAWFPNLTELDSSWILPVTLGALNLAIIEIQVMSRAKQRTKLHIYATHFFRALSIGMIPIAASVPSALCLYWTASSSYGLAQNLLLLAPGVRRVAGIPKTDSELPDPFGHIGRLTSERWATLQTKLNSKISNGKTE